MKKRLAVLMALIFAVSAAVGCAAPDGTKQKQKEKDGVETKTPDNSEEKKDFVASGDTIRFAVFPCSAAVPAYRAKKQGYFEDLGLNVDFVTFQTGVLVNEGLGAGEVDIGINGFATVYAVATGEYDFLGDLNTQFESGIYANPDCAAAKVKGKIEGFPDVYGDRDSVKGMNVLLAQGTIAQIIADSYMAKLGVAPDEYNIVGMDTSAALTALLAGHGEAAALFPPYSTQALDAGYIKLASFKDACDCSTADTFMGSKKFIKEHYDDTVLLCRALYKAAAELEANDDLYYEDAMAFFSENGKEYSDHDMRALIDTSYFYDNAHLTDPEYQFGYHLTFAADNLIRLGLLPDDEQTRENVRNSVNKQVIKDALGIDLKVGFYGK